MSWMNIIHKAKTIRQETAPKTGNRLVPTSLLGGLPSRDVPSLNENVNRDNKIQDQIRINTEAETKNVRDKIAEQQYLIQQEKRGERILADGTKANTMNNPAYIRARNDEIKRLNKEKGRIEAGVRQKSGLKQRQASNLARDGENNWKKVLRTQGNKAPAQSVRQTTGNVPKPTGNVPRPTGTTPAKDPLVGFAQDKGLMPQPTQNVPRPMGNVPINKPPSNLLPKDAQGNVIPAKTPTKPIQNVELPDVPQQTQQQVTQEATQAASQPTTAQLSEQARLRQQEPVNDQNKKLYGEKYLEELRRFNAVSPKQQKKDAKAKAKEQARQQKQQEKEAKRQAKQNPRAGGQLVRRNPNSRNPNSRLVARGTARRKNSVLRPKKPRAIPVAKSDELSKSIKNILRR
jgi:hypothetical protein